MIARIPLTGTDRYLEARNPGEWQICEAAGGVNWPLTLYENAHKFLKGGGL